MIIGIDIGGTKCAVIKGNLDENGKIEIIKKIKTDTKNIKPEKALDLFCKQIDEIADGEKIDAIGVSCGGPLDEKRGVIMSPPNLPGWDDVEIKKFLENKYHVSVSVRNDANACALAEWKFGAARGYSNVVFLTFGTGMGAGLILDGKLYSGTNGMAGEAGHIRLASDGPRGFGKNGSFEGFCSGGGIAKMGKSEAENALKNGKSLSYCKNIGEIDDISAKKIAECANEGFDDAKEIYRKCAQKLGMGLSILIDVLNPEIIVIGSVFKRAYGLLADEMQKVLEKEALSYSLDVCKIVPAEFDENLGDLAALAAALDK
ncbi:ROK family protein [Qingrenia yutianensis]|uniref:ROK family protein n=1 Tax=Qingrenia yutianensis TaxID=2763676 RepID=A0A926ISR3_9FIRM|nr:ROK family protein [Qingrenia yutianensis]MBC8596669.1 ROK family protein [Qingrenia yutianensis]